MPNIMIHEKVAYNIAQKHMGKNIKQKYADDRHYWEKYPDLRFGQLVCNIVPENQLFYVEDDIMLERIQDWEKNRR